MVRVLIADDEANLRKVLCTLLEREGHETVAVEDGEAALAAIGKGDVDILITDLRMPGMSGLDLLRAALKIDANLPVIVITAHGSVDTAVSALKDGAFDYITKPFDKDELRIAVRKAISVRRAPAVTLSHPSQAQGRFQMLGQSQRMRDIFAIIEKIAATPSTVLVTGESGTGKELVASALHANSPRKDKPFIKVNCAAIPKDLMESEFFGYEQGAFTGAVSSKPGRFELADGGTLFLDEIAEIPKAMQVKLLRALQEGEFERVGGVRTMHVDVRVIAATNRDLAKEIEAGRFREDLFYRLNVVPVALPSLRERSDDIPLLANAFIEKNNKRLNKAIKGISEAAVQKLVAHAWPGNIRELENVIERTVLFTEHDVIEAADLPESLATQGAPAPAPMPVTTTSPLVRAPIEPGSMKEIVKKATVELERDLIVKALDETAGNVTRAATLLGISRKGLQNKMKEYGLRGGDDEPEAKP
ncbi:MAG: sigma-54-dependent Fis family transcriptional regulator [Deltaproteobacteria bacterium]|nr:sigma-54-dependent Fis family transcriptional regulator [Deltaproteobacteria bacterium]